jgi:hypothetical protein
MNTTRSAPSTPRPGWLPELDRHVLPEDCRRNSLTVLRISAHAAFRVMIVLAGHMYDFIKKKTDVKMQSR